MTEMMRSLKDNMPSSAEVMRALKGNMPNSEDVLHTIGLQYERNAQSALTTVTAFAVGAIAGAVLATLFSPRSGSEMRQELNERVRAWSDRMGFSARPDENERSSHH